MQTVRYEVRHNGIACHGTTGYKSAIKHAQLCRNYLDRDKSKAAVSVVEITTITIKKRKVVQTLEYTKRL